MLQGMHPSEVHRSWGKRIRARREALGFTQTALAELIGVHQPAVSAWEHGSTPPKDETKFKIAGALGLTVEELFPYPAVVPPFPTNGEAA